MIFIFSKSNSSPVVFIFKAEREKLITENLMLVPGTETWGSANNFFFLI